MTLRPQLSTASLACVTTKSMQRFLMPGNIADNALRLAPQRVVAWSVEVCCPARSRYEARRGQRLVAGTAWRNGCRAMRPLMVVLFVLPLRGALPDALVEYMRCLACRSVRVCILSVCASSVRKVHAEYDAAGGGAAVCSDSASRSTCVQMNSQKDGGHLCAVCPVDNSGPNTRTSLTRKYGVRITPRSLLYGPMSLQ
jgi:hypothetical protein